MLDLPHFTISHIIQIRKCITPKWKPPDEVADLIEDNPNEATHFSCCNACNAYSNDFWYLEDPKTT